MARPFDKLNCVGMLHPAVCKCWRTSYATCSCSVMSKQAWPLLSVCMLVLKLRFNTTLFASVMSVSKLPAATFGSIVFHVKQFDYSSGSSIPYGLSLSGGISSTFGLGGFFLSGGLVSLKKS